MKEGPLREILSAIGVDVRGKNGKGWLVAHCPFAPWLHNKGADHNPDFHIKIDPSNISGFFCFACKQSGRISSMVRKLEFFSGEPMPGLALRADCLETPDSFEDYNEGEDALVEPEPLNKDAFIGMYPLAWEDTHSRNYMTKRGITEEACRLMELVYDDDECRILFPVFNHNKDLFGYSGRTILESRNYPFPGFPKVRDYAGLPKEKLILGEHLFEKGKPIVLVEGLFAYAHLISLGCREFCNPAASLGSRLSDYQRDVLTSYGLPVHLLYDMDEAGELGLFGPMGPEGEREGGAAYDKLREHVPTFIPEFPEGITDPDNLTREQVLSMIEQ